MGSGGDVKGPWRAAERHWRTQHHPSDASASQVQTDGRVTPIAATQNTVTKLSDTVRQIREQFVVRCCIVRGWGRKAHLGRLRGERERHTHSEGSGAHLSQSEVGKQEVVHDGGPF